MVRWRVTEQGFRFEGLPPFGAAQPVAGPGHHRARQAIVVLGPEPLIGPSK